jgi:anaerobic ribonucleoside-triphosphate reductase activating protein
MNYSQIRKLDISDGEGIRVSVFVSGCERHCKGCFNPETWDFNAGKEFTSHQFFQICELLKSPHYAGLSLLGGEPFIQKDNYYLIELCKTAHFEGKNVWAWSGFKFEELIQNKHQLELLKNCDVLVDGPFIESQRNLTLAWRGSSNQRVIDVKKSLAANKVVLYK